MAPTRHPSIRLLCASSVGLVLAPFLVAGIPAGGANGPATGRAAETPSRPPGAAEPSAKAPVPARTVLLRYQFREGEVVTYRLILSGKGTLTPNGTRVVLPVTLLAEADVRRQVVRVRAQGGAEVAMTYLPGRMVVNGVATPGPPPPALQIGAVVAPSGAVLEWRQAPGGAHPLAALGIDPAAALVAVQRTAFPERPVKARDSWAGEAPDGSGEWQRTTLVAIEGPKDKEVARLKLAFALPLRLKAPAPGGAAGTMTGRHAGDLTLRFDARAGVLLGAAGSLDVVAALVSPAGALTDVRLHLSLRLERVPEQARR